MSPTMKNTTQPISILLCALGGEGGGVLAEWLVDAARRAGYPAQAGARPVNFVQRALHATVDKESRRLPGHETRGLKVGQVLGLFQAARLEQIGTVV